MADPSAKFNRRARKRLAEFERTADNVHKALQPLNKALMQLLGEGRLMSEGIATAKPLATELQTLLSLLGRLGATSDFRAKVARFSQRSAQSAVARLERGRPEAAATSGTPSGLHRAQAPAPVLRGSTRALPVSGVVELLATWGLSGTLRVTTREETLSLVMREGDLVSANSDHPPTDQLLGSILVAQGAIEGHVLERFLEENGESSTRIGRALQGEELVTHEELRRALEEQIQQCFNRMFDAEDATFCFFDRDPAGAPEDDEVRMNVTQLLLESARTNDESRTKPHHRDAPSGREQARATRPDVVRPARFGR